MQYPKKLGFQENFLLSSTDLATHQGIPKDILQLKQE